MPYTDFLKDILINYFVFGCNGSLFLCGFFSGCSEQRLLLQLHCSGFSLQWLLLLQSTGSRACRLQQLWHVGSVVVAPGLQSSGSVVVAHGLSCYIVACEIFPDQVSNPYLLHWQVDYLALSHQGSSIHKFVYGMYAAAKSLQSCPTLCDPIDGSPPGSPVPGILQARTLEWVAISFSNG